MTPTELQLAAKLALVTEALRDAVLVLRRSGWSGFEAKEFFHDADRALSLSPDAAVLRAKADALDEAASLLLLGPPQGAAEPTVELGLILARWLKTRAAALRAEADRLPAVTDDAMGRAVEAAMYAYNAHGIIRDSWDVRVRAAIDAALRELAGDAT